MFMKAVDRFDQLRATNPIIRQEQRVLMSLFTFLTDTTILNG